MFLSKSTANSSSSSSSSSSTDSSPISTCESIAQSPVVVGNGTTSTTTTTMSTSTSTSPLVAEVSQLPTSSRNSKGSALPSPTVATAAAATATKTARATSSPVPVKSSSDQQPTTAFVGMAASIAGSEDITSTILAIEATATATAMAVGGAYSPLTTDGAISGFIPPPPKLRGGGRVGYDGAAASLPTPTTTSSILKLAYEKSAAISIPRNTSPDVSNSDVNTPTSMSTSGTSPREPYAVGPPSSSFPQPGSSSSSSSSVGGGGVEWQPDSEAKVCNDCYRKFTFTRRRHHCRACGLIFCNACSRCAVRLRGYNYPVRVCNDCKQKYEQAEKEKWSKWEKVADWDILLFLGEGAFGKVYKVRNKQRGDIYAMKVVEKSKLKTSQAKAAMQGEKLLLQNLSHPYIVKLHQSFQTHDKLFMLMDYLPGGDCYYLMTRLRFPEEVTRLHAAQITLALHYLHEQNIVYRDLKPENCVLDHEGFMVLTDFGLAKEYDEEGYQGNQVGTPDYWAPELFRGEKYGRAVDFWALGCLIYEMISGKHPFMNEKGLVTKGKVLEEEPQLHHQLRSATTTTAAAAATNRMISPACEDIIRKLLHKSAGSRLQTLPEMKAHPWFTGLDWEKIYRRQAPLPAAWKRPPLGSGFDPCYTSQQPVIAPTTPTEGGTFDTFEGFTWKDERASIIHE